MERLSMWRWYLNGNPFIGSEDRWKSAKVG